MEGVTYFDLSVAAGIGLGIVWGLLATVLMTEPEGRRAPLRMLCWCAIGWITSVAVFVGVGVLDQVGL
jgi:hypothetical protein